MGQERKGEVRRSEEKWSEMEWSEEKREEEKKTGEKKREGLGGSRWGAHPTEEIREKRRPGWIR